MRNFLSYRFGSSSLDNMSVLQDSLPIPSNFDSLDEDLQRNILLNTLGTTCKSVKKQMEKNVCETKSMKSA